MAVAARREESAEDLAVDVAMVDLVVVGRVLLQQLFVGRQERRSFGQPLVEDEGYAPLVSEVPLGGGAHFVIRLDAKDAQFLFEQQPCQNSCP